MNLQKLKPWNWIKEEESGTRSGLLPQSRGDRGHPMSVLHREIDRLFDDFLAPTNWLPGAAENGSRWLRPTVDISETDREYRINVEIPGVEKGDIRVDVRDDQLVIHGEKKQENEEDKGGYHRVERAYGSFQRILNLPPDADARSIDGKFRNGVLKLSVPKTEKSDESSHTVNIN